MSENSSNKLTKGISDKPSRPSLCLIWLNGPFMDKKMAFNIIKMLFLEKVLFYPKHNLCCYTFFRHDMARHLRDVKNQENWLNEPVLDNFLPENGCSDLAKPMFQIRGV